MLASDMLSEWLKFQIFFSPETPCDEKCKFFAHKHQTAKPKMHMNKY